MACENGHKDVVEMLLRHLDIDVNKAYDVCVCPPNLSVISSSSLVSVCGRHSHPSLTTCVIVCVCVAMSYTVWIHTPLRGV